MDVEHGLKSIPLYKNAWFFATLALLAVSAVTAAEVFLMSYDKSLPESVMSLASLFVGGLVTQCGNCIEGNRK